MKKLNDYVISLINKRWAVKQQEKKGLSASPLRRQDVLDKCLDAISPSDWNEAAAVQVQLNLPINIFFCIGGKNKEIEMNII